MNGVPRIGSTIWVKARFALDRRKMLILTGTVVSIDRWKTIGLEDVRFERGPHTALSWFAIGSRDIIWWEEVRSHAE